MVNYKKEGKDFKLRDINSIDFGSNIEEITSSLEIVLTLFENDDDPEIIGACKIKLKEGVGLLKKLGAEERTKPFNKF